MPPKNTKRTRANPYPYHPTVERKLGWAECYFDPATLEPLCLIPAECASWTAQYVVAIMVRRLTGEGKKPSEVRKQTEAFARAYNDKHLQKRAYIETIQGAIKTSMEFEARGWNSRPDEAAFYEDGTVMAFRFELKK
ncbi:hypothetical protein [Caulobacter sp. 17J80-11]|uniref:hypothetical protein n=1 Tax=Caulobacter sp. 17J80-11 TaxID=2763502 RepID=UPI0016535CC0|nr:hypothetical protein [Caulobacter sp. 17J80-11]MBC6982866.1 hypothetical protein [Caulobacter sp. 17J80-11]